MLPQLKWEQFKKTPTYGEYLKHNVPSQTSGTTPGETSEDALRKDTDTKASPLDKETTLPPLPPGQQGELPSEG